MQTKVLRTQTYRKGWNKTVLTVQDGDSVRRILPSTLAFEREAAAHLKAAQAIIGKRVATYTEQNGAFIGIVTRVCKRGFIVKTRGGAKIKLPNCCASTIEKEMTFEVWDSRLESAKVELPACGFGQPRFTL